MIEPKKVLSLMAFLALAYPSILLAQIEGRVSDESGLPIAQARVELVAADTSFWTVLSDSAGLFRLQAHPLATGLRVSALSMAPTEVPLGDLMHRLEVVLFPEPLELPPLETVSTPFECPKGDEPGARRLWSAAMARYSPIEPASYFGAEVTETKAGVTWPEAFGDLEVVPVDWAEVGGSTGLPKLLGPETVRETGYAIPQDWGSINGREGFWRYVSFDHAQAYYLSTPWFAALQEFGILEEDELGARVAFCDERRRGPGINGQIHIDAEGWVRKVEWQIRTPEPEEEVGGQANFPAEAEFFLPASSAYWRKTSMGKYYQEARRFSPWYVGDSDGWKAVRRARIEARGGGRQ